MTGQRYIRDEAGGIQVFDRDKLPAAIAERIAKGEMREVANVHGDPLPDLDQPAGPSLRAQLADARAEVERLTAELAAVTAERDAARAEAAEKEAAKTPPPAKARVSKGDS